MPSIVQLILPNNLKGSYIKTPFIDNEASCIYAMPSENPGIDQNNFPVSFGINIIDYTTRLPIRLDYLQSVSISNDPDFLTSIPIINNWPSGGYHYDSFGNPDTDYTITLNSLYFYDITQSFELSRTSASGTGQFIINGWPLSGNGGLSTVYIKVIAKAIDGTTVGYPSGYNLYDQILWETERPSTPGVPVAITSQPGWVGRRAAWRFAASEEASTGMYGTGVARYCGDIIELRNGDSPYVFSTDVSTSPHRTIANNVAAAALLKKSYVYNSLADTFTPTGPPLALNSAQVIATSGVAWYTQDATETDSRVVLSPISPDYVAQAVYSLIQDSSTDTISVQTRAFSVSQATDSGAADELVLQIDIPSLGNPVAKIFRIINGAQTTAFSKILPAYTAELFITGGALELYVATHAGNIAMQVSAHFTPQDSQESIFLGSDIVPVFVGSLPFSIGAAFAAFAHTASSGSTVSLVELAQAQGRLLIDVDLGDCQDDNINSNSFATTSTTNWITALTTPSWIQYMEANESGSSITPTTNQVTLKGIVTSPVVNNERSYAEVIAASPTFSDRVLVDFSFTHTSGDFYVAFSPNIPTTRPIGTTFDESLENTLIDTEKPPVLGVVFSAAEQQIFIVQRLASGLLRRTSIIPHNPLSSTDTYSIELNNSYGSNGLADGAIIILRHNQSIASTYRLQEVLPVALAGLGWYVAMGTRSSLYYAFGSGSPNVPATGLVTLGTVSVTPLIPNNSLGTCDPPSIRHFMKGSSGNVSNKTFLGQHLISAASDNAGWLFTQPGVYAQRLSLNTNSAFLSSVNPLLFEINVNGNATSYPQIAFLPDNNGSIANCVPEWITAQPTSSFITNTGALAPLNGIVQFVLDTANITITNPCKLWIAIKLPSGCSMAAANAINVGVASEIYTFADGAPLPGGVNWYSVTSLWYKLFANYVQRYDNIANNASLQTRVRAESYASVSSNSSALSEPVSVDIQGPLSPTGGVPYMTLNIPPALRSVTVNTLARDTESGILAFRVGKEIDSGAIIYGKWQSWSAFSTDDNQITYTTYLYGTEPVLNIAATDSPTAVVNNTQIDANMGGDGSRRVWMQIMDGVGNVTETAPITTLAQSIAIVDTVPPDGNFQFVNAADGSPATVYNTGIIQPDGSRLGQLTFDVHDNITSMKDIRLRPVGSETWSNWFVPPIVTKYDLLNQSMSAPAPDGIYRMEAQFRDYGNNAQQAQALWSDLKNFSEQGIIVICMTTWTPPGTTNALVYMSAINSEILTSMTLISTNDSSIANSYQVISYNSSSFGRLLPLRISDQITLVIDEVVWEQYIPTNPSTPLVGSPTNGFYIDSASGYIVTNASISSAVTISVSVNRYSAQIYVWDSVKNIKLADLGYSGERAILSMCPSTSCIYLGGASGNIWKLDGQVVTGPVYTTISNGVGVPVSYLGVNQFACETISYLYAGTSQVPMLFRAPLSNANSPTAWSQMGINATVEGGDNFLTAPFGNITCGVSAFNTLFLGTNLGKVLQYQILTQRTNSISATEYLTISTLKPSNIGNETSVMPVAALAYTNGQVFAGIGDRPEIYNFTMTYQSQPFPCEEFNSTVFDRIFSNDPNPWQFYSSGFPTLSRPRYYGSPAVYTANPNISWLSIADSASPSGYNDAITLSGTTGNVTTLTQNVGSDWEQAMSVSPTSWTFETNVLYVSGDAELGRQGFQISDGRYFLDVSLSCNDIKINSGANLSTVPCSVFGVQSSSIQIESLERSLVAQAPEIIIEPTSQEVVIFRGKATKSSMVISINKVLESSVNPINVIAETDSGLIVKFHPLSIIASQENNIVTFVISCDANVKAGSHEVNLIASIEYNNSIVRANKTIQVVVKN